ncbi:MAG: hypothetical protein Q8P56_03635 [Candidatus Uhrbacteria bacterium]|nr:hypothetical protein [Candidatus Uhrbacteria bacterium]
MLWVCSRPMVVFLVTEGTLTSLHKIKEQLKNFMKCIGVTHKISQKKSGYTKKLQTRVQFSDVLFYRFLVDAGLTPAKSKTIGSLVIPQKYFFDFLRGEFDGDGCFYSYFDPRWKSSFMYYLVFTTSSEEREKV